MTTPWGPTRPATGFWGASPGRTSTTPQRDGASNEREAPEGLAPLASGSERKAPKGEPTAALMGANSLSSKGPHHRPWLMARGRHRRKGAYLTWRPSPQTRGSPGNGATLAPCCVRTFSLLTASNWSGLILPRCDRATALARAMREASLCPRPSNAAIASAYYATTPQTGLRPARP